MAPLLWYYLLLTPALAIFFTQYNNRWQKNRTLRVISIVLFILAAVVRFVLIPIVEVYTMQITILILFGFAAIQFAGLILKK